MSRYKFLCLLALLGSQFSLQAEEHSKKSHPFDLTATQDHILSSKFKSPHKRKSSSLSFTDSNIIAGYTQEISTKNGLNYGIGYNNARFDWKKHSPIKQKNINNLLLKFGGYTKEREDWRWDANVYLQMNTDNFSLSRYTLFRGFLHGVYDWKKDTRLHVGLEGIAGMHYTRVWPTLGFDYKYSKKMRFSVVVPSNISALYSFDDHISAIAAVRYFLSRQRLGDHESHHMKRGLIAYRNVGVEVGLNYEIAKRLLANIHVGQAMGGRVRLSHKNDHHRKHYTLKSAPYFGAQISISF